MASLRASGVAGVLEEVDMDVKRLGKRNFGRDDRSVQSAPSHTTHL